MEEAALEYKTVYDAARRPTGKTIPRGSSLPPGEFTLAARLWIRDARGRLLIQKRAADKRRWAGRWDCSAAGGVRAGETTAAAILREAREELGLTLEAGGLEPLLTITDRNRYDDVFLIRLDAAPSLTLQESELTEARWVFPQDIPPLVENGAFLPYVGIRRCLELMEAAPLSGGETGPGRFEYRGPGVCLRTESSPALTRAELLCGGISVKEAAGLLERLELLCPYGNRWELTVPEALRPAALALGYRPGCGALEKREGFCRIVQDLLL